MTDADYRKALEAAAREWETLAAERAKLDQRLGELQQTIATLSRLCGYVPTVPFGLADGCRLILMRHEAPLSATRVREELEAMGFELSKHANPLASVHVTLKRLVEAGQARFLPGGPGRSPQYAWKGPKVAGKAAPGRPALRADEIGARLFGYPMPAPRPRGSRK
jgi:hypothetical protein